MDPVAAQAIFSIATNLVSQLIWTIGDKAFKSDFVDRAMLATAQEFGAASASVLEALNGWVISDSFSRLIRLRETGQLPPVADFVADFSVYCDPSLSAPNILHSFFPKLAIAMMEDKPEILAARIEVLHGIEIEQLNEIGRNQNKDALRLAELTVSAMRQDGKLSAIHEEVKELRQSIRDSFAGKAESAQAGIRFGFDDELSLRSSDEWSEHSRIDSARKDIERGNVLAARQKLTELRNEEVQNIWSEYLRFRIATNLGVCLLRTLEFEQMRHEFMRAKDIFPYHPFSWANAANAELFNENFPLALSFSRKAIELSGRRAGIYAIHLTALDANGKSDELVKLLESDKWLLDEPEPLSALGQIHFFREEYETSEKYFALSCQKDPYEVQTWILRAQNLAKVAAASYLSDIPLDGCLRDNHVASFERALSVAQKAIELSETQDYRHAKHRALVVRGAIHRMMKQPDLALKDSRLVLAEDPANRGALYNLGLAYYDKKLLPEAEAALGQIDSPEDFGVTAIRARIALELGDSARASELIEQIDLDACRSELKPQLFDTMIETAERLGDVSSISRLIEWCHARQPRSVEYLISVAQHYRRVGKYENAAELLRQGGASVPDNVKRWIDRELAITYCEQARITTLQEASITRYKMAAEVFERFVDAKANSDDTHNYIVCLANAGMMRKAAMLARELRGNDQAQGQLSEIELTYYVDSKQWASALEVVELLLKACPSDSRWLSDKSWIQDQMYRSH